MRIKYSTLFDIILIEYGVGMMYDLGDIILSERVYGIQLDVDGKWCELFTQDPERTQP